MKTHNLSKKEFRALGILPLAFFAAQATHYLQINEPGHMLWMCNIGNLLLAIGMFLEEAVLIRVAVLWMFPGVAVWFFYVVPTWGMLLTGRFTWSELYGVLSSAFAHLGGISVGMFALRRVRMDGRAWFFAFLWYFAVQLLSRLVTPVALNINLSRKVQEGWEQGFPTYWKFWLVLSLLVGVCLWILNLLLKLFWPPSGETPIARPE